MNVYEISNKLNLRSSDYVANLVVNQELLATFSRSCKGVAVLDAERHLSKIRKNPELKNVKFIDFFRDQIDENAYDKIVCLYDEYFFGKSYSKTLSVLYKAVDKNGYVLIVGVPEMAAHGNKKQSLVEQIVDWVCEKNLSDKDYWIFENSNTYDILFKARKQ